MPEKSNTLHIGEQQFASLWVFHQKLWWLEDSEMASLKCWKKKTCNPEYCLQQNYPWEMQNWTYKKKKKKSADSFAAWSVMILEESSDL